MKRNLPPFAVTVLAAGALTTAVVAPSSVYAQSPTTKSESHARQRTTTVDPELAAAIRSGPTQAQWPNSNYARILDLGDVTVQSDGTVVATYREAYRLFNERGRSMAEVSLPYNSSYQSLKVVSARTVKKDGTVVDVRPEDIRATSPYSDYLMYDDAMAVGFSMPAVEDDCVIDYTYKMVTRPMFMPGNFWTYWGFSGQEPVGTCRYTLHAPADKPIKYRVYNDDAMQPTVTTSPDGRTKTYVWEKDRMAPIEMEPSMPNPDDVRVWMEASSLGSWQDIAHWFWTLEQPQAQANDAIRATVATLTAGKTTDEEKARAIYDWVANHVRYVGLEFGLSAYKPHAAAEVQGKLYGDCKDKATLLCTMLGLVGIKASPVLLHAEDRRSVSKGLPTLNAFDHCIALASVSGKDVWLDATAETCAYGDVPDGDRGVEALVVDAGSGTFETIPNYTPADNGMEVKSRIALKADGGADSQSEIGMRGGAGQAMRAAVRSITPDQRKEMVQKISEAFSPGATLKDFLMPDGTDKVGPYVMRMTIASPSYAHKTGNLLLVPASSGTSNVSQRNPFVKDKRVWPIVQEENSRTTSTTEITVPAGYKIEDTPANLDLIGPLGEYHRKLVVSPDGAKITVVEVVEEHAGKVSASDYAKVKSYYDGLVKTSDDLIVLKKPG